MLGSAGWTSHPARLAVGGRVIRLGWFASLPVGLLTAICAARLRVDLLLVPPGTDAAVAEEAMAMAAAPDNNLRTPDVLAAALAGLTSRAKVAAQAAWESDGGHAHASGL